MIKYVNSLSQPPIGYQTPGSQDPVTPRVGGDTGSPGEVLVTLATLPVTMAKTACCQNIERSLEYVSFYFWALELEYVWQLGFEVLGNLQT